MNKILVVDGSNVLHRAYHGLPLLKTTDGRYTNAAYGFMMMLQKIMDQEQPTHVAICFDKGKNTFRHKQYTEYKAQRKPLDPELVEQFPLIREVLALNGFTCLELDEYEADDIIATLARRGQENGDDVLIFSGDKDLLQMLDTNIRVISGKRSLTDLVVTDVAAFKEKYGLEPIRLIDLKGLMGDPSDNLPGVAGVGEKTALKLLHQYGTIENVYQHIEEMPKNKLREKLERDKENAFLSYKMAEVIQDVPLDFTLKDLRPKEKSWKQLRDLYRDLEFRSLLPSVEKHIKEEEAFSDSDIMGSLFCQEETSAPAPVEYQEITDEEEFLYLIKEPCQVFGAATGENLYFAVPSGQVYTASLAIEGEKKAAEEILAAGVSLLSHDLKGLIHLCQDKDMTSPESGDDLEIMAYLLEATVSDYTMAELIHQYLDKDLFSLSSPEREKAAAALSFDLYEILKKDLEEGELISLYQDIERPLVPVLAHMEIEGIRVNKDNLEVMSQELEGRLAQITAAIYQKAGVEFNINSPKQMSEVLFEKMGLRHLKKTKTGYSTNNEVLEQLKGEHPIIDDILLYRQLAKLKSTYTDALEKLIDPRDNAIHTVFRQTVTSTGRLSSTDPNLQNIPVRLEEGRKVRKAFTARDEDHILLAADYSQIELRILAHYAGDEALVESFLKNEDIHARTAGEIFDLPLDKVDKNMRRKAKAVNFGIIYGISDYGLGRDLGIGRYEAKEYIDKYFQRYPGVERYLNETVALAKEKGYVTTLMGRRRYLPNINHKNYNLRSFAERTAMNTPIQGTAADVIKKAMVDLYRALSDQGLASKMVLQVHDELILDCPKEELAKAAKVVKEVMEHTVELKVPLTVEIKTGEDWYSLHEYEVK